MLWKLIRTKLCPLKHFIKWISSCSKFKSEWFRYNIFHFLQIFDWQGWKKWLGKHSKALESKLYLVKHFRNWLWSYFQVKNKFQHSFYTFLQILCDSFLENQGNALKANQNKSLSWEGFWKIIVKLLWGQKLMF